MIQSFFWCCWLRPGEGLYTESHTLPETKGGKEEKSQKGMWRCSLHSDVWQSFNTNSTPTAHSRLDRKRPKGNVQKQSISTYSDRAGVVRAKVLNSEPNVCPSLTLLSLSFSYYSYYLDVALFFYSLSMSNPLLTHLNKWPIAYYTMEYLTSLG